MKSLSLAERWRKLRVEECEDRVLLSVSPAGTDDTAAALVSTLLAGDPAEVTIPELETPMESVAVTASAAPAPLPLSALTDWTQDDKGVYCRTVSTDAALATALADVSANTGDSFFITLGNNVTINANTTVAARTGAATFVMSGAGAYHIINAADTEFNDCTFINFKTTTASSNGIGGCLTNNAGKNLTLNQCEFFNCTSTNGDGGAIYNKGTLNVTDCTFSKCTSAANGSAIQNWNNNAKLYLNIYGSNYFYDCTASGTNGAAVHLGRNAVCSWRGSEADLTVTGYAEFHNCSGTYSVFRLPDHDANTTITEPTVNCNVNINTWNCGATATQVWTASPSGWGSYSPTGFNFTITAAAKAVPTSMKGDFLVVGKSANTLTLDQALALLGQANPNSTSGEIFSKIYFADTDTVFMTGTRTLTANTVLDATQTVSFNAGNNLWSTGAVDAARSVSINGTGAASMTVSAGVTASLKGLSLEYITSTQGGAFTNNGTLNLENCAFRHCSATAGGAIYNNGAVTVAGDVLFAECSATSNGGAVFMNAGSSLDDVDATGSIEFRDCSSSNSGGALYVSRPTTDEPAIPTSVTLTSPVTVTNCSAHLGGAFLNNGSLNISNLTANSCFSSATASADARSGGAVYNTGTLTLGTSSFTNCQARNGTSINESNGGAIWSSGDMTWTGNMTFDGCSATHSGGAVYLAGGTLNQTGTGLTLDVTNCSARNGGGFYSYDGAVADLGGITTFTGCSSLKDGGAICCQMSTGSMTFRDAVTFTGCTATESDGDGGAVYNNLGTLNFNSTVSAENCTAGGNGGALWSAAVLNLNGDVTLTNCDSAGNGGGLYLSKSPSTSVDSVTTANGSMLTATNCDATGSNGGALYVSTDSTLNLNCGLALTDCTALSAGGLFVNGSVNILSNRSSVFTRCQATGTTGNGGAIYCNTGTISIDAPSTFRNCSAVQYGGAIYTNNNSGSVTLEHLSNFVSCSAASGGAFYMANGQIIFKADTNLRTCTATDSAGYRFFYNSYKPNLNAGGLSETMTIYTDIREFRDYSGHDNQYGVLLRYSESGLADFTGDFIVVDSWYDSTGVFHRGTRGITLESALGFMGLNNTNASMEGVYFKNIYFDASMGSNISLHPPVSLVVNDYGTRADALLEVDGSARATYADGEWTITNNPANTVTVTYSGGRIMTVTRGTEATLRNLTLQNYETGGTIASGGGLVVHGDATVYDMTIQNCDMNTSSGTGIYIGSSGSLQVKGTIVLKDLSGSASYTFFNNAASEAKLFDNDRLGVIKIYTDERDTASDYQNFNKIYGVTLIYQESASDVEAWQKLTGDYIIVTTSADTVDPTDNLISLREAIHYLGIWNENSAYYDNDESHIFTKIYFADTITGNEVILGGNLSMFNDAWYENGDLKFGVIDGNSIWHYGTAWATTGNRTDTAGLYGVTINLNGSGSTNYYMQVTGDSAIGYDNIVVTGALGEGSFRINQTGSLYLDDVRIVDSKRNQRGGAIFNEGYLRTGYAGGTTIITGASAGTYVGGGIFVSNPGHADLGNTIISGGTSASTSGTSSGTSSGAGIGIGNYGIVNVIGDVQILNNIGSSASGGGGIANMQNSTPEAPTTFTVKAGGKLTVSGNQSSMRGGGIHVEAGTFFNVEKEETTVEGVTTTRYGELIVSNNTLTNSKSLGAGIYNIGTMTLYNTTVDGNYSKHLGGGLYNAKGGVMNFSNGIISNNVAKLSSTSGAGNFDGSGAGVMNLGRLNLADSVIKGNKARSSGGGIYNAGDAYLSGTLYILENDAQRWAGGCYTTTLTETGSVDAKLIVTDGTKLYIAGNRAGERGGGLYNATNYYEDRNAGQYFETGEDCMIDIGNLNLTTEQIAAIDALVAGAAELLDPENDGYSASGNKVMGTVPSTSGVIVDPEDPTKNLWDGDATTTSSGWGGGYYTENAWTIGNGTIIRIHHNIAATAGGGMYLDARSGFVYADDLDGTNGVADIDIYVMNNRAESFFVTENGPGYGGGVYNEADGMELFHFHITDNYARVAGGGIYNVGTLIIVESEIDDNTVDSFSNLRSSGTTLITFGGGGIFNVGTVSFAGENSVSGNKANGGHGGGIYSCPRNAHGVPQLRNAVVGFDLGATVVMENNMASERYITYVNAAGGIVSGLVGGKGGGIYVSVDEHNSANAWTSTMYVFSELILRGNTARYGGGMYLNTFFQMTTAAAIEFVSNNNSRTKLEEMAYDDTDLINYGGGLYLGSSNRVQLGSTAGYVRITNTDSLAFSGNGDLNSTYGGAIYNAANVLSFSSGTFEYLDANYGLEGAFLFTKGAFTVSARNIHAYDVHYATPGTNDAFEYHSDKTFTFLLAHQEGGSAIAFDTGANSSALENVRLYANKSDGLYIHSGAVAIDKGSEIGTQPKQDYSSYLTYADFTLGNDGSAIRMDGGILDIECADDCARARYANEDTTLQDYQVLSSTVLSGNGGYGLKMTGGIAYVNTSRIENNGDGVLVENADLYLSESLVSDWSSNNAGMTVQGAASNVVELRNVTIARDYQNTTPTLALNGTGADHSTYARVKLYNSIVPNIGESDVTLDPSDLSKHIYANTYNCVQNYADYDFQMDVMGNQYTLGDSSVALNTGLNADAFYYDYDPTAVYNKAIEDDIGGHSRILYTRVDLGAFEQPILYMNLDDFTQEFTYLDSTVTVGWLDDVKTACESVASASQGGRVVFSESCNGAVFLWYTHYDEETGYNFNHYSNAAPPKVIYFDNNVAYDVYKGAVEAAAAKNCVYANDYEYDEFGNLVLKTDHTQSFAAAYPGCTPVWFDKWYELTYTVTQNPTTVTVQVGDTSLAPETKYYERQAIIVDQETVVDARFNTADPSLEGVVRGANNQSQIGEGIYHYWMDVTLDAQGDTQLFYVSSTEANSAVLSLYGLTLANGDSDSGNTIQEFTAGDGGGIYIHGNANYGAALNLYSVSIEGCHAADEGGAIYGNNYAITHIYTPEASGSIYGRTVERSAAAKNITEVGYINYSATWKLSVFENNTALYGGAMAFNGATSFITINGMDYEYGLVLRGDDLSGKSYLIYNNDLPATSEINNTRGYGTLYCGTIMDQNLYWTDSSGNTHLLRKSAGSTHAALNYSVQFINNGTWNARAAAADITQCGGAIYCMDDIRITGASFVDNGARQGGAIYLGTGLDSDNTRNIELGTSDFLMNAAGEGGALFITSGEVNGQGDLVFARNQAATRYRTDNGETTTTMFTYAEGNDGGAIAIYNDTYTAELNLKNLATITPRTLFGTMVESTVSSTAITGTAVVTYGATPNLTETDNIEETVEVTNAVTNVPERLRLNASVTRTEYIAENIIFTADLTTNYSAWRKIQTIYSPRNETTRYVTNTDDTGTSNTTYSMTLNGISYTVNVAVALNSVQYQGSALYLTTRQQTMTITRDSDSANMTSIAMPVLTTTPEQTKYANIVTTETKGATNVTTVVDKTYELVPSNDTGSQVTVSVKEYITTHTVTITPELTTALPIHNTAGEVIADGGNTEAYALFQNRAWDGGAIASKTLPEPHTSVVLENSRLQDNRASNDGGAVYFQCMNYAFDVVNVNENSAGRDGGGMFINAQQTGTYSVSTVSVVNNTAARNGGGFYLGSGIYSNETHIPTQMDIAFGHSLYVGIYATGRDGGNSALNGGGMYVSESATIKNEGFIKIGYNTATHNNGDDTTGYGGGVYLGGSWVDAQDTIESDNREMMNCVIYNTGWKGGGVYLASGCRYEQRSNCYISYNKGIYGGAFYSAVGSVAAMAATASLEVSYNNLNMTEENYGAGIYAEYGRLFIPMCEKINNVVRVSKVTVNYNGTLENTLGGGMYFQENGIYNFQKSITSDHTQAEIAAFSLDYNVANKGGAIYLGANSTLNVGDDITITGNNAIYGGGLYMAENTALTYSCTSYTIDKSYSVVTNGGFTFRNNNIGTMLINVNNYGGGIYVADGATCSIFNSLVNRKWKGAYFENNGTLGSHHGTYGGAVYVAGTLNVTGNATLEGNQGLRGGAINVEGGVLSVNDDVTLTVTGNMATYGGGICLGVDEGANSGSIVFEADADGDGKVGCIDISGNNIKVMATDDGTTEKHESYNYGGAFYIDAGVTLRINDKDNYKMGMNGCVNHTYGGLVGLEGTLDVADSISLEGQHAYCGGAIYDNGHIIVRAGCTLTIQNNQATYGGGVYSAATRSYEIEDNALVHFYQNTAHYGGARYIDPRVTLAVGSGYTGDKVVYENNGTANYTLGGAIYNAGTLIYNGTEDAHYLYNGDAAYGFVNNITNYALRGSLIFNVGELTFNYVDLTGDQAANIPGSVAVGAGTVTMNHVTMTGNQTRAAVIVRDATEDIVLPWHLTEREGHGTYTFTPGVLNVNDSEFYDNFNLSISILKGGTGTINRSIFHEVETDMVASVYVGEDQMTTAGTPGAVTSVEEKLTINDSWFYGHVETALVVASDKAYVAVNDSKFFNNEYAIRVHIGEAYVANSLIRDWSSEADGRGIQVTNGMVTLVNSTVACYNDPTEHNPVSVTGNGNIRLVNSIATNAVLNGKVTSNLTGTANAGKDVLSFEDYNFNTEPADVTTRDRYMLTADSANALDRGLYAQSLYQDKSMVNGTMVTTTTQIGQDLKNATRKVGDEVDLGAYESTDNTMDLYTTGTGSIVWRSETSALTGEVTGCDVRLSEITVGNNGPKTVHGFKITYYVTDAAGVPITKTDGTAYSVTVVYPDDETGSSPYELGPNEQIVLYDYDDTPEFLRIAFSELDITTDTEYFIHWDAEGLTGDEDSNPNNNHGLMESAIVKLSPPKVLGAVEDVANRQMNVELGGVANATLLKGSHSTDRITWSTPEEECAGTGGTLTFGLTGSFYEYYFHAKAQGSTAQVTSNPNNAFYLDSLYIEPPMNIHPDIATSELGTSFEVVWNAVSGKYELRAGNEPISNVYVVSIPENMYVNIIRSYYDPTVPETVQGSIGSFRFDLTEPLVSNTTIRHGSSVDLLPLWNNNAGLTAGVYQVGWRMELREDGKPDVETEEKLDNNYAKISLLVVMPEITVQNPQAGSLTVNIPDASKIIGATQYAIEYSTDPTFASGVQTTAYGTATTVDITGLTQGVTYYFRVAARDAANQPIRLASVPVSATLQNQLIDLATDNSAATFTAKQTTPTRLVISGLDISNIGDRDSTQYFVTVELLDGTSTQVAYAAENLFNLVKDGNLPTDHTFSLILPENLAGGDYTVHWHLTAINPNLESDYTNNDGRQSVSLYRPTLTVATPLLNPTTSLDVNIAAPAGHPEFTTYEVQYWPTADSTKMITSYNRSPGTNTFTGLLPGTSYTFRTYGVDAAGNRTLWSEEVSAATQQISYDLAANKSSQTGLSTSSIVTGSTLTAKDLGITNLGALAVDQYRVEVYAVQGGTSNQQILYTSSVMGAIDPDSARQAIASAVLNYDALAINTEYTVYYRVVCIGVTDGYLPNNTTTLGNLIIRTQDPSIIYAENGIGWLDDVKYAIEYACTYNTNVTFDVSCTDATFVWYDWDDPSTVDTRKNRDIYDNAAPIQIYTVKDPNWPIEQIWVCRPDGMATDSLVINVTQTHNITLDAQQACTVMEVYDSNMVVTIHNLTFRNGKRTTTQNGGGGLCVSGASTVNLYNVSFVDCSAYRGGAIYGGSEAIINVFTTNDSQLSRFTGNTATYGGGAIYVTNKAANALNMRGQVYSGTAFGELTGAALYYTIQLYNNTSAGQGGAVYLDGNARFENVSVTHNIANYTGNYAGGGMLVTSKGVVTAVFCDFLSNESLSAGAGVALLGTMNASGVIFAGNYIKNDGGLGTSTSLGGGIYVYQNAALVLDKSLGTTKSRTIYQNGITSEGGHAAEFLYNEAFDGGGAYFFKAAASTLDDAAFRSNLAAYGGGIYVRDTANLTLNATYSSNYASRSGSDIWRDGTAVATSTLKSGSTTGHNGVVTGAVNPYTAKIKLRNITVAPAPTSGSASTVSSWDPFELVIQDTDENGVKAEAGNAYVTELYFNTRTYMMMADTLQTAEGVTAEIIGEKYSEEDGILIVSLLMTLAEDYAENGELVSLTFQPTEDTGQDTSAIKEVFGTVITPGLYDLVADGVVDIYDLIKFAKNFGKTADNENTSIIADFNEDGIVDIYDLVRFAKHFGDTREGVSGYGTQSPSLLTAAAAMEDEEIVAESVPESVPEMEAVADTEANAEVEPKRTDLNALISVVPSVDRMEWNDASEKPVALPEECLNDTLFEQAVSLETANTDMEAEDDLWEAVSSDSQRMATDAVFGTELNWEWLKNSRKNSLKSGV